MARKPLLTEAELKLPEYLQTYTGYGDDHGNYKWSERAWRTERNRWLGRTTPKRVSTSFSETLLTDILALCESVVGSDKYKPLHDQATKVGASVEMALAKLRTDNENRRAQLAKARTHIRTKPVGRPLGEFKLTDGQGHSQTVLGLAEVARLTGSTPNSVAVQLSRGGGKAWLGQRDPEHSWTVERVGTETA